jgi:hypothetical protein
MGGWRGLVVVGASVLLLAASGCGGSSGASARNITCKEVNASTAKTEVVAKELVTAVQLAGGRVHSSESTASLVRSVCEIGGNGSPVKPEQKAFMAAVAKFWHEQGNPGEPPASLTK